MSNLSALQRKDAAHHLHPFTDSGDLAQHGTRIIKSADGVYLTDAEGRRLLDGMAGLWCVNIGYGRQELADAAAAQFRELPYYNSFFQCTTPPAIELSEMLAGLAPAHMNHVFFSGSGSEANDTVIRMVRHYWACMGHAGKDIIVSRHNAYHGSTVAAASLGGMKPMHKQGGLPIPGIVHIDQPYWFGEGRDEEPAEFGLRVAHQLEQKIEELGADRVAAFIGEPVQGAGGVIVPPDSYWPEIQRICDKYNILLVSDEVITGFGRLGSWFGAQHYGTKPDLMPVAKGLSSGYLPIGGVIVADHMAAVLKEKGGEFFHGYTYSGHPVCAAVAMANLKILREEGIVEYVRDEIGPYFQQQWHTLADHPLVGEARGVGMLGALELVRSRDPIELFEEPGDAGNVARDLALENGLVMRAVGSKLIVSPPLVMQRTHVDELVVKARATLDAAAERLL
ncbi:MAG: aspartate aminotransferase family protein [Gammaproteobacteria bacterium]|nr:aspartate aminotransferase family protein [Gammaproteobacteria bacterium]NNF61802.1 aspartate aminotransferase family protein [Gammaproteobacteria bacterium]NNM19726.1 aspartate aminotransferase family protein [Gammaproteobacteria bacterium]